MRLFCVYHFFLHLTAAVDLILRQHLKSTLSYDWIKLWFMPIWQIKPSTKVLTFH